MIDLHGAPGSQNGFDKSYAHLLPKKSQADLTEACGQLVNGFETLPMPTVPSKPYQPSHPTLQTPHTTVPS
jgi:hypothetical protein